MLVWPPLRRRGWPRIGAAVHAVQADALLLHHQTSGANGQPAAAACARQMKHYVITRSLDVTPFFPAVSSSKRQCHTVGTCGLHYGAVTTGDHELLLLVQ